MLIIKGCSDMYKWITIITGEAGSKTSPANPSSWSRCLYSSCSESLSNQRASSDGSSDKELCGNVSSVPCPTTPGRERRHSPPSLTSPGYVGPALVLSRNPHTPTGNTVYDILYQPEDGRNRKQTEHNRRKHSRKYPNINKDKNNPFINIVKTNCQYRHD